MSSRHALQVHSYDGRLVSSPKLPAASSARLDLLTASVVGLSDDTVAVRDGRDARQVHLFDAATGQALGKPITHPLEILDVKLDQVRRGKK